MIIVLEEKSRKKRKKNHNLYSRQANRPHTLVLNKTYATPFPKLVPGSRMTRTASMLLSRFFMPENN